MKKRYIILILICVALIGTACYYKNFITSVFLSVSTPEPELKKHVDDKKKIIEDATGVKIREFTSEEKDEINDGITTEEVVIGKIIKESIEKSIEESEKNKNNNDNVQTNENETNKENNNDETIKEEEKKVTDINSSYLAKIYSLQEEFSSKIGSLYQQAEDEYSDLWHKNQGGPETKRRVLSKYMGSVTAFERECDSRFEAIVSEFKEELTKIGADTSIIKRIKDSYVEEKNLKRAYYIKMMQQ